MGSYRIGIDNWDKDFEAMKLTGVVITPTWTDGTSFLCGLAMAAIRQGLTSAAVFSSTPCQTFKNWMQQTPPIATPIRGHCMWTEMSSDIAKPDSDTKQRMIRWIQSTMVTMAVAETNIILVQTHSLSSATPWIAILNEIVMSNSRVKAIMVVDDASLSANNFPTADMAVRLARHTGTETCQLTALKSRLTPGWSALFHMPQGKFPTFETGPVQGQMTVEKIREAIYDMTRSFDARTKNKDEITRLIKLHAQMTGHEPRFL